MGKRCPHRLAQKSSVMGATTYCICAKRFGIIRATLELLLGSMEFGLLFTIVKGGKLNGKIRTCGSRRHAQDASTRDAAC